MTCTDHLNMSMNSSCFIPNIDEESDTILTPETIAVNRVNSSIADAGENAFGVMGVDVWIIQNDARLHHFQQGVNWVHPIYKANLLNRNATDSVANAFDRLVNIGREDYAKPEPQPIGVGLAGNCFARSGGHASLDKPLKWRLIDDFVKDPDQMPYERMVPLGEVFGKVTGVPFDVLGTKGVVLYFARSTACSKTLNTASNAKFLYFATHHIASALAMSNVPNLIFSHENLNKDCISRRTFYRAASKLSLSSSHSSRWGDIDKSTVSEDESATPVETTPRKPKLSVKEAIYELMLWDKVVAKGRSILKKSLKPRETENLLDLSP